MGVPTATLIGLSVAAGTAEATTAGIFGRRRERRLRQQIKRQRDEELDLIRLREQDRRLQLARVLGVQEAALTGGRVVGGTTRDVLARSAVFATTLASDEDRRATQERILTLDFQSQQSREASRAILGNTVVSLFSTAVEAGVQIESAVGTNTTSDD